MDRWFPSLDGALLRLTSVSTGIRLHSGLDLDRWASVLDRLSLEVEKFGLPSLSVSDGRVLSLVDRITGERVLRVGTESPTYLGISWDLQTPLAQGEALFEVFAAIERVVRITEANTSWIDHKTTWRSTARCSHVALIEKLFYRDPFSRLFPQDGLWTNSVRITGRVAPGCGATVTVQTTQSELTDIGTDDDPGRLSVEVGVGVTEGFDAGASLLSRASIPAQAAHQWFGTESFGDFFRKIDTGLVSESALRAGGNDERVDRLP